MQLRFLQPRYLQKQGFSGNQKIKTGYGGTLHVFSQTSHSRIFRRFGKTDVGLGLNLLSDNGYRKYNDEKLGRISLRIKHRNEKVTGLIYGLNVNSGIHSKN